MENGLKHTKQKHLSIENIPSDDRIATLCRLVLAQKQEQIKNKKYAPVKTVLSLIGLGVLVAGAFVVPGSPIAVKPFLDEKKRKEREEWTHFNPSYVRRTIKRLAEAKCVVISEKDGKQIVTLSKFGKRRILKYALDELTIRKPNRWDGKWRLIIYDVDNTKRYLRDIFRGTLKSLGFFQLQESVWIYPYPCEDQITFLREYYGVGDEVVYIVAIRMEDDSPYRTYFNI